MKIGIFGRHPIPQPGFMGVMSLFEAIYLSRRGWEVDLILPFKDEETYNKFLANNKLDTLNDLQKFNGYFEIIPIFYGAGLSKRYDCIIYQSYNFDDHQMYMSTLRAHARMMTKNFPKFVPSAELAFHETVESSFKVFDLVACALQDDIAELRSNSRFWQTYGERAVYVPRGADPLMLHPGRKLGSRPTIGLEIPLTPATFPAIEFYIEPLRRLQAMIPSLRILTLGEAPHPEIKSEHMRYARFDRIYDDFFNEIWLHLIMDYSKSPGHVSAPVQKLHPQDWSGRAIYEVQNIEAQMSGAIVIGHKQNTIPELLQPGASALHFKHYDDHAQIAALMRAGIDNFPFLSRQTRQWAEGNFSWEHCMSLWGDAIEATLERMPPQHP